MLSHSSLARSEFLDEGDFAVAVGEVVGDAGDFGVLVLFVKQPGAFKTLLITGFDEQHPAAGVSESLFHLK